VRKIQKFPNSRWRTDAILKIIFGYNSAPYCPIRTRFGMKRHNRTRTTDRWWKCQISEIQHGGRPPFWKSLYLHISAANCPNFTKLSMQTQISQPRVVRILSKATKTWEKSRNSQIQDGGRTPYWNHFLAITRLHIVRIRQNLEWRGIIARSRRLGDENVQFRKSNMAYGRHLENHYISRSQPQIVQIARNLVCRQKFYRRRRKRQKIRKLQIQYGGCTRH